MSERAVGAAVSAAKTVVASVSPAILAVAAVGDCGLLLPWGGSCVDQRSIGPVADPSEFKS